MATQKTRKPKKTAQQRRSAAAQVTGRTKETYDTFIENVHLANPDSTYLSQLLDPEFGDLRDVPCPSTQDTHVFRAKLANQIGPDVNGRSTFLCQPHPLGRMLQYTGAGTSDIDYAIRTNWQPGFSEQFLRVDPLGTTYDATDGSFGGSFLGGEHSLSGIPGTDANQFYNSAGLVLQTKVCYDTLGRSYQAMYCAEPDNVVWSFPNGVTTSTAPYITTYFWHYDGSPNGNSTQTFAADPAIANGWYFNTNVVPVPAGTSWIGFSFGAAADGSLTPWGPTAASPQGRPVCNEILRVRINGCQTVYRQEHIPGYSSAQPDLQRVRVVSMSVLATNLSSGLNDGGYIACGTLPGGTVGDPRFSFDTQSVANLPTKSFDGPLKLGAYGYWAPETRLQLEMMQSPVPHDRTLRLLPALIGIVEFGRVPEGSVATPQVMRYKVYGIVAATTISQVLGPRRTPNAPAEVAMVLECLSRTPRWSENPLHEKLVAAAKKAFEMVKKHGPAALSLAEKGVKYGKYLLPLLAAL